MSKEYEMVLELQSQLDSRFTRTFDQAQRRMDDMEQILRELGRVPGPEKARKDVEDLGEKYGFAQREAESFHETVMRVARYTGAYAFVQGIITGFQDAINMVGMYEDSLKGLQAETGASVAEMDGLQSIVDSLYARNYGDSYAGVSQGVAEVRQITQLAGKELEDVSSSAFAFAETFGYDIKESIRTAMNMSRNFGISVEESFNLMTQGAQKGLDSNGDMLDTFNEYSVFFSQMGFESAQMLDVINTGMINGARNTDLVADGIKEIGILAKDGSKETKEALDYLGFDFMDAMEKLAGGGKDAQRTYQEVVKRLAEVEDPLIKNGLAVDLFGTKAEDLEVTVIDSLANVQREFDKTIDSMDAVKEIRYGSVSKGLQGIGRQLQLSLLQPIEEDLLPYLNELANWFNSPAGQEWFTSIQEGIGSAVDTAIDLVETVINHWPEIKATTLALTAAIVTMKIGFEALRIIGVVTDLMKAYRAGTLMAHLATLGLNTALLANPITIVVGLIGVLVGALVWMGTHSDKTRAIILKVWETLKDNPIMAVIGGPITALVGIAATIIENWNPMEGFFYNMWNGIKIAFSDAINWIIDKMNWLINKMNSFKIEVPDFLGGGTIGGFNIDTIDHINWGDRKEDNVGGLKRTGQHVENAYADGGIVTGPEVALIGEGGDAEAVIPMNNKPRSKALLAATANSMGYDIDGGGTKINFAPQINLYASASREDGEMLSGILMDDFRKLVKEEKKREQRVKLAYGN